MTLGEAQVRIEKLELDVEGLKVGLAIERQANERRALAFDKLRAAHEALAAACKARWP